MMTSKKISVVVSCSVKFHAFALVEQLQKNGIEVIFFTSYSSVVNPFFKLLAKRVDKEEINPLSIRTNLLIAVAIKLFRTRPQIANNFFDKWVSRKIQKMNADIFIGWSGMALNSINEANKKGMFTILERGSAHIEIQNELLKDAYKVINKDFSIQIQTINKELLEYRRAKVISIPSNFCLNTFLKKGIQRKKLFVNPYGVSQYFKPVLNSGSSSVTILYLGKLSIQKGVHLLLNSINILLSEGLDFKFIFIGQIENEVSEIISSEILESKNVTFMGHIDHYKLNELIGTCDVGIVPSIQDGFAMVVPQILRVGLPVIVSENAGAEQIIKQNENGWVIEPKIEEITDQLKWCVKNHKILKKMRATMIKKGQADDLSWDKYGIRYINFLKDKIHEQ
jgi:starch synthase